MATKFVISILGTAVCGAVLLLLIPSRVLHEGDTSPTPLFVLGALGAVFGAAARYWRPGERR